MRILILLAVVGATYAQGAPGIPEICGLNLNSQIWLYKNFTGALDHCRKLGKQLHVPRREICVQYLYKQMRDYRKLRAWIGLSRRFDVNDSDIKTFRWEGEGNQNKSVADHWGPNEPNNFRNHKERCVEVRVLEKNTDLKNWNDAPCDRFNWFYCQELD